MKVLDPGHRYLLDDLEASTKTEIHFSKTPELHGGDGYAGPTCQEYLRAMIDRVQTLDAEKPWAGNQDIIYDLRHALAGFEARALLRHVEKENLAVEKVAITADGHFALRQES